MHGSYSKEYMPHIKLNFYSRITHTQQKVFHRTRGLMTKQDGDDDDRFNDIAGVDKNIQFCN